MLIKKYALNKHVHLLTRLYGIWVFIMYYVYGVSGHGPSLLAIYATTRMTV